MKKRIHNNKQNVLQSIFLAVVWSGVLLLMLLNLANK